MNGVRSNIQIHGELFESTIRDTLTSFPDLSLNEIVFLVDIEGAEHDIFHAEFLEVLSPADLIIEVHDRTPNRQRFNAFKRRITSHEVLEVNYSFRDPKSLKELAVLMDDDCWLLMSEGRSPMKWLYLKSIAQEDETLGPDKK